MENYCEFVKFSLNFDTLVACPNTFLKVYFIHMHSSKKLP